MLDSILKYATSDGASPPFTASERVRPPPPDMPERMQGQSPFSAALALIMLCLCPPGNRLHHYSHVLDPIDPTYHRPLPPCPRLRWAMPHPLNSSAVGSLLRQRTASSSLEGASDGPNRNLKAHGGLEPLGEEVFDTSSNYLLLCGGGVGLGALWWLCKRRRPRSYRNRRSLLARFPIV